MLFAPRGTSELGGAGGEGFDAFGNHLADVAAATGNPETLVDPVGFGGQYGYYFDQETGKSLLGHRYYDSAYGRFLNRDPIGYNGGLNLYGYAGNNPITGSDPSGFDGKSLADRFWDWLSPPITANNVTPGSPLANLQSQDSSGRQQLSGSYPTYIGMVHAEGKGAQRAFDFMTLFAGPEAEGAKVGEEVATHAKAGETAVADAWTGAVTWVTRKCAGKNHFVPRAMGSMVRYGHRILTPMDAMAHSAFHTAYDGFLKTYEDGAYDVNAWGNSGKKVMAKFTALQRQKLLELFYAGPGSEWYDQFREEFDWTVKNGKWH